MEDLSLLWSRRKLRVKERSRLPLFSEFLRRDNRFNMNPRSQDFHVRAKDFTTCIKQENVWSREFVPRVG